MPKENITLEDALALARLHDNRNSKYAVKRSLKNVVSDGKITTTVGLTEVVKRQVLNGNVEFMSDNKVKTINLTSEAFYSPAFDEGQSQDTTKIQLEDIYLKTFSDIVGKSPKLNYYPWQLNNGVVTVNGVLSYPMVGLHPLEGQAAMSRADVYLLSRVNIRVKQGRVRTIIVPQTQDIWVEGTLIKGVLPCWQSRKTYGEAEPYIAGSGQCDTCSRVVLGGHQYDTEDFFRGVEGYTYCDDAVQATIARQNETSFVLRDLNRNMSKRQAESYIELLADAIGGMKIKYEADYWLASASTVTAVGGKINYKSLDFLDFLSSKFNKNVKSTVDNVVKILKAKTKSVKQRSVR